MKVNEIVTNKIIEKLEAGINPWVRPWGGMARPKNYITNKSYHGINLLLLDAGYYLTMNQIVQIGGHLKKGSKGQMVVYFAVSKKEADEEEEEENKFRFLKYYYVFSLKDVENYTPIKNRKEITTPSNDEFKSIEKAERAAHDYLSSQNISFTNTGDRAFYMPAMDAVVVPEKKQFKEESDYYSTLFHELGHSTGPANRLNRESFRSDVIAGFGSKKYAKEELVAEITSAFITSFLEIDTTKSFLNSVAYLQSWSTVLKKEPASLIVSAASFADKAMQLILGIKED